MGTGASRPVAASPGLLGPGTATLIVMANMIGTGVFTSLGFQVASLHSVFALLMLWLVGGAYALCGALSYGELAACMPRSGGEYQYLSRIYHPAIGFLAGWVSVTVGFAAPIAAAAMALGHYMARVLPGTHSTAAAFTAVIAVAAVHLASVRVRSSFQSVFTSFKVLLILALIVAGLLVPSPQPISLLPTRADLGALFSAPFAVSFVYVTYAYCGWNASVYLAGETRDPARTVPRSLLLGTAAVTVLYVLLNFVFLRAAPISSLEGQVEVAFVASGPILGAQGARVMGFLISFGLVSAISSMTWAGPRVLLALGQDIPLFRSLAQVNHHGVPHRALLLQLALVIVLIATSSFESVITYLGFTLSASTLLAVLGVFVHRFRFPETERPYRTWGYPVTPAFFVLVTVWMLVFLLRSRPWECLAGLGTLALGLPVYLYSNRAKRPAAP